MIGTDSSKRHSWLEYQLQQELIRLHGGDTFDEAKTDSFKKNLSVSSSLENRTLNEENLKNISNVLRNVQNFENDKPIVKDSNFKFSDKS